MLIRWMEGLLQINKHRGEVSAALDMWGWGTARWVEPSRHSWGPGCRCGLSKVPEWWQLRREQGKESKAIIWCPTLTRSLSTGCQISVDSPYAHTL